MRYLQIDQGEKDASQDFGPDCRGRRVMYLTGDVKLVGTSKLETILSGFRPRLQRSSSHVFDR